jgi:hypothetical protein
MFVRRLMARVVRVVSDVACAPRRRRASPFSRAVASRAVAAIAATSPAAVPRVRARNWLEDGKRLRPARSLHRRVGEVNAATGDAARERLASRPRRVAESAASSAPATSGASPASVSPPAVPSVAPVTAEHAVQAADGLDEERRRLIFVRYLVRQRVYNEGFGADEVPDQYRWQDPPEIAGEQ